jgi:hypothetical protein
MKSGNMGTGYVAVHYIIHNDFSYKKVAVKWIPRLVSDEQKAYWL